MITDRSELRRQLNKMHDLARYDIVPLLEKWEKFVPSSDVSILRQMKHDFNVNLVPWLRRARELAGEIEADLKHGGK